MEEGVEAALGVGVLGGVALRERGARPAGRGAASEHATWEAAARSRFPPGRTTPRRGVRGRDGRRDARSTASVEPSRRQLPADAPGQGQARERHLPRPGGAQLRRARSPTAATSTPRPPRPTASAPSKNLSATVSRASAQPSSIALASTTPRLARQLGRRPRPAPASSVAITISAASPLGLRPTSMSSMLTPASPRIGADRADHARAVVVAHDEHVARRRQVDDVLVDADDARRLVLAVQRAGDVRGRPPATPRTVDEVHVVARRRTTSSRARRCRAPRRAAARSRTSPARRRPGASTPFSTDSVSTRQS